MNEYIEMWKNFFDFGGKSNLREFWMAILFHFIASVAVALIATLLKMAALTGLYALAVMIPVLALQVRRLRDAGKGWGWIFITLVPLVGWIIYIVMLCKPSVDEGIVDAA